MIVDESSIAALMQGEHGDPFSILGMHPSQGAWVVRALLPGAVKVEVIDGAAVLASLARQGDSDLFAGVMAQPAAYRLRVDWGSHQQDIDDPYRLAPVLGDTAAASAVLEAAGVSPTERGEQLTVHDFLRIARAAAAPAA